MATTEKIQDPAELAKSLRVLKEVCGIADVQTDRLKADIRVVRDGIDNLLDGLGGSNGGAA